MDMEDDSEYRKALKKKKAKEQAAILEESSHDRASDLTADLIEQELAAEQKQEKKRDLEERNALWRAAGGKHSRRLLNLIRTLYQEIRRKFQNGFSTILSATTHVRSFMSLQRKCLKSGIKESRKRRKGVQAFWRLSARQS